MGELHVQLHFITFLTCSTCRLWWAINWNLKHMDGSVLMKPADIYTLTRFIRSRFEQETDEPSVEWQRKQCAGEKKLKTHHSAFRKRGGLKKTTRFHPCTSRWWVLPWSSHTGSWCWPGCCWCSLDISVCCYNPGRCQRRSAGTAHLCIHTHTHTDRH